MNFNQQHWQLHNSNSLLSHQLSSTIHTSSSTASRDSIKAIAAKQMATSGSGGEEIAIDLSFVASQPSPGLSHRRVFFLPSLPGERIRQVNRPKRHLLLISVPSLSRSCRLQAELNRRLADWLASISLAPIQTNTFAERFPA